MRHRNNMPKHYGRFVWLTANCLAVTLTVGCSHLTVAPKPVPAKVIAFDQNAQNAGVIDCDKNGCIVTPGWIGRYRAMEKEFNQFIPADNQIAVEGQNYRVSYEISNHYAQMRAAQRGGP